MTGSEDLEIDTLEQAEALQQSVLEDANSTPHDPPIAVRPFPY